MSENAHCSRSRSFLLIEQNERYFLPIFNGGLNRLILIILDEVICHIFFGLKLVLESELRG